MTLSVVVMKWSAFGKDRSLIPVEDHFGADPSIGIADTPIKMNPLGMESPLSKPESVQTLLTTEEREFLDSKGYLPLGCLLSDEQFSAVRQRVDELVQEEGQEGGHELFNSKHIKHPKEEGVDRLANLVNKGEEFDLLYTHPKLLAAVHHVLGSEIQLSSLNYRAAKPGKGLQKLHVDWKEAVSSTCATPQSGACTSWV